MDQEGELEWGESVQGFVLGSFFYGYAITQIVGGRAAEVYGVRWVFGSCILAGGVSALLSPIAARTHYGLLITVRFLQGMCQGVSWPSMHALIVQWTPPLERPRFIGFVYFGEFRRVVRGAKVTEKCDEVLSEVHQRSLTGYMVRMKVWGATMGIESFRRRQGVVRT
uniref:Major facilitator superfamily (MFS) profile domain-containing protein n=1 Tax=Scylla olivacea TaxID=85551 RepID=A0A0P4WDN5_SCYOL